MRLLSVLLSGAVVATAVHSDPRLIIPDADQNEWGETVYEDPIVMTAELAADWVDSDDTPEAVVMSFFASHMRGDEDWIATRATEVRPRNEDDFAEWDAWQLMEAEITGQQEDADGYVTVFITMGVQIGERIARGQDTFATEREGEVWRIQKPPS